MNVPLLDLKLQYQSLKSEIEPVLMRVAESQALILGEEVVKLEKSIAEYCDCKYAIGVSSGTDALLAALMALEIGAGDEVILPDYSFFATAGVVARLNAKPVFVDSEPESFNINPSLIEKYINKNTKAIIPVHLYGQVAAMNEILEIANNHGIPVIEDCAQSIGAQYFDGRKCGSIGLMGCFSFYPTKNLGGFGDGGIITTNDEKLATKLRQMRNHGMEPKYYHSFIGGNFRLDAIQAAVLNIKLPHLEDWHEARRRNGELYTKLFIEKGLSSEAGFQSFDDENKVLIPKAIYQESGVKNYHIYNQYCPRIQKRDELRQFLSENNIGSEIYYPVPFHNQPCFAKFSGDGSEFPVSNALSSQMIALPIFPELTADQISYVVDVISEFFK